VVYIREGRHAPPPPAAPAFAQRLARRFGTPLLVYDLAVLRHQAAQLRRALPADSTLLYSLKANPLPPVVGALQRAGCGSEVSSPGELAAALGTGTAAAPVLYTGPGKSADELRAAAAAGAVVSVESAAEAERARRALDSQPFRAVLRIQPSGSTPAGLSMADGRQFGLLEDEAVSLCRDLHDGIEVLGFHCYLGSQLPTCQALLDAFAAVADLMTRLARACGIRLRIADLGGGFPWPYAAPGTGPDLAPLAAGLEEIAAPLYRAGAQPWFESGRGLVAAAGRLLTSVMDVKQREGRTLVVVDAGVNVLGGMTGLGRVLRPATVLHNLSDPDGGEVAADVVGPLCTPLDRLAVNTAIAAPRVGDLLCVENVGAYGATAALSPFLSRPAAVEVVVNGEEVVEAWSLRNRHEPVALTDHEGEERSDRVGGGQASASTRKPM
jgi:diaminopimelate decarboxylase